MADDDTDVDGGAGELKPGAIFETRAIKSSTIIRVIRPPGCEVSPVPVEPVPFEDTEDLWFPKELEKVSLEPLLLSPPCLVPLVVVVV